MLDLHAEAPAFALDGVAGGKTGRHRLADYRGRWVVLFFYPADFTFVCPTEVTGFEQRLDEFTGAGAVVLGISVDSVESHREWASELGRITFPLLSDPGGETSRAYGVLDPADSRAFRATAIVSPEGRIAYVTVSPMNVGRSVEETLRVLQALQTGRMCPADWKPGQPTLDPDLKY